VERGSFQTSLVDPIEPGVTYFTVIWRKLQIEGVETPKPTIGQPMAKPKSAKIVV
jgi:hypothetical protein